MSRPFGSGSWNYGTPPVTASSLHQQQQQQLPLSYVSPSQRHGIQGTTPNDISDPPQGVISSSYSQTHQPSSLHATSYEADDEDHYHYKQMMRESEAESDTTWEHEHNLQSQSISFSSGSGSTSSTAARQRSASNGLNMLRGYFRGQLANVVKMGIWWTIFGPLILSLFHGRAYAVGGARVAFNTALFFCSPLAGALVERIPVRTILARTVLVRGLIYAVFLPIIWLCLQSGWFITARDDNDMLFFGLLLTLMFLDGMMVSFSNIADIDCGGIDLVAAQHGSTLSLRHRHRFNYLHGVFFDGAMIVLSPIIAFAAIFLSNFLSNKFGPEEAAPGALMLSLAIVFAISTLISLYFYMRHIPGHVGYYDNASYTPPPLTKQDVFHLFMSVADGFKLCWKHRGIRYRLLFLALETSFEDAMISLIIAVFAIKGVYGEPGHDDGSYYARGNMIATGIIAVGKLGGVISSAIIHRTWQPNQQMGEGVKPFRGVYVFVFLAGLCTLLMPLAYWLHEEHEYHDLALSLCFVSSFLFFLFSTAPKIGFATMLQVLAAETGYPTHIFSFVAAFLTCIDSIVLLGLSFIFESYNIQTALLITCGIIAGHGLIELCIGPYIATSTAIPRDVEKSASEAFSASGSGYLSPSTGSEDQYRQTGTYIPPRRTSLTQASSYLSDSRGGHSLSMGGSMAGSAMGGGSLLSDHSYMSADGNFIASYDQSNHSYIHPNYYPSNQIPQIPITGSPVLSGSRGSSEESPYAHSPAAASAHTAMQKHSARHASSRARQEDQ